MDLLGTALGEVTIWTEVGGGFEVWFKRHLPHILSSKLPLQTFINKLDLVWDLMGTHLFCFK